MEDDNAISVDNNLLTTDFAATTSERCRSKSRTVTHNSCVLDSLSLYKS